MPATDESSCSRSGFKCAIGVLAGTIAGDAMVRDCVHIARRDRVMRLGTDLMINTLITVL